MKRHRKFLSRGGDDGLAQRAPRKEIFLWRKVVGKRASADGFSDSFQRETDSFFENPIRFLKAEKRKSNPVKGIFRRRVTEEKVQRKKQISMRKKARQTKEKVRRTPKNIFPEKTKKSE